MTPSATEHLRIIRALYLPHTLPDDCRFRYVMITLGFHLSSWQTDCCVCAWNVEDVAFTIPDRLGIDWACIHISSEPFVYLVLTVQGLEYGS